MDARYGINSLNVMMPVTLGDLLNFTSDSPHGHHENNLPYFKIN